MQLEYKRRFIFPKKKHFRLSIFQSIVIILYTQFSSIIKNIGNPSLKFYGVKKKKKEMWILAIKNLISYV